MQGGNNTTPVVSVEQIEAAIVQQHFFTAGEALAALGRPPAAHPALGNVTVCALVLENGFTMLGTAYCADPTQFDVSIGRQSAREDAIRQLFPVFAHLGLQQRHQQATGFSLDSDAPLACPRDAAGRPEICESCQ